MTDKSAMQPDIIYAICFTVLVHNQQSKHSLHMNIAFGIYFIYTISKGMCCEKGIMSERKYVSGFNAAI